MSEASVLTAECGCRYKVTTRRSEGSTTGVLELVTICVRHSYERTKYLARQKIREIPHDKSSCISCKDML